MHLLQALKTYHQYHIDCLAAEGKLKEATRLEEKQTGKSSDLGLIQSGGQRRSSMKKMERLMEKVKVVVCEKRKLVTSGALLCEDGTGRARSHFISNPQFLLYLCFLYRDKGKYRKLSWSALKLVTTTCSTWQQLMPPWINTIWRTFALWLMWV